MYRRMLHSSSVRPEEKRVETVAEIKAQFRKNAADVDEEKVEELLKKANSSLGYLKRSSPALALQMRSRRGRRAWCSGKEVHVRAKQ